MARYDYDCAACGRRFEAVHGVFEDAPTVCPLCGSGPVKKAFSPPTIHFKGSGWAKKERQASTASRASRSATPSGADAGSGDASDSTPSGGSTDDAGSGTGSTTTDTKPTTPKTTTTTPTPSSAGGASD